LPKALKAASPPPVVVAPKETGNALAPPVSTALDTLKETHCWMLMTLPGIVAKVRTAAATTRHWDHCLMIILCLHHSSL